MSPNIFVLLKALNLLKKKYSLKSKNYLMMKVKKLQFKLSYSIKNTFKEFSVWHLSTQKKQLEF
jgi:hypothetical protein